MNRDVCILITHIYGARKTVDVGLALSPLAKIGPYSPYKKAGFELFSQDGETESEKIKNVFKDAFERDYKSVITVSHSVPNLPLNYLEDALSSLRNGSNLVIGPLRNGMFYLIGMTRKMHEIINHKNVLNDITFDNSSLRDSTVENIKSHCNGCSILPEWYILKSIKDLKKMHNDYRHGIGWKAQWTHNISREILG
jgi:glycosyltransferase A (GT-A) superfamily protein (DUF2064 family)